MVSRTIKSLLEHLECDYVMLGQEDIPVDSIAPVDKGTSSDLSFCSSDDHEGLESILNSCSGIILCKRSLAPVIQIKNTFSSNNHKLYVFVDNPRLVFIRAAKLMKAVRDNRKGVSKHAIIADSAKIGRDCFIGDLTIIGDECIIGDNVIVDSRVVLKNTIVGNNCTL
ncbi:MAG: hypothetical protein L0H53_02025, partial [Candidatus Nitrosocosmicus sp.]|nr:hypothetical protein [Candidatus Nitrosocosmicus sp.]